MSLPPSIAQVFADHKAPETFFTALMPVVGKFLNCDRCFLYLRDPETGLGRVPFFWLRDASIPKIYDEHWKSEPAFLVSEDPMFAAALRLEPSIFINDIETADVKILSKQFEKKSFGHRSLIHAHLCKDNRLWGILQPCIFNNPRDWTNTERQVINHITVMITPIAVEYVLAAQQI